MTSAAISGSAPSASMNSFSDGFDSTASSICCFCKSICAADLNFSCSNSRLTSSLRGSSSSSAVEGIPRQQHFRLDVDQHRGHVDKFSCNVHIQLANLFHVRQILRRDLCNRNVVDVDVLLADQVQQQIDR